jgi:hypothetical protein
MADQKPRICCWSTGTRILVKDCTFNLPKLGSLQRDNEDLRNTEFELASRIEGLFYDLHDESKWTYVYTGWMILEGKPMRLWPAIEYTAVEMRITRQCFKTAIASIYLPPGTCACKLGLEEQIMAV